MAFTSKLVVRAIKYIISIGEILNRFLETFLDFLNQVEVKSLIYFFSVRVKKI
jgi:hypothetical protein